MFLCAFVDNLSAYHNNRCRILWLFSYVQLQKGRAKNHLGDKNNHKYGANNIIFSNSMTLDAIMKMQYC